MSLRTALFGAGIACLAIALLLVLAGGPVIVALVVAGALLVLGILFERPGYKPVETARPGPGWQETEERFEDPATGRILTVFIEPATGERRYVDAASGR